MPRRDCVLITELLLHWKRLNRITTGTEDLILFTPPSIICVWVGVVERREGREGREEGREEGVIVTNYSA